MANTKERKHTEQRDFVEEYKEIMRIVGKDMHSVERDWHSKGEHIKKFTLLQETPFTIQTDNTNPLNL